MEYRVTLTLDEIGEQQEHALREGFESEVPELDADIFWRNEVLVVTMAFESDHPDKAAQVGQEFFILAATTAELPRPVSLLGFNVLAVAPGV